MRVHRFLALFAILTAVSTVIAGCVPAPPGGEWSQANGNVRGHVIVAGTHDSSTTVVARGDTGGVIVAFLDESTHPSGWPRSRALRLAASGAQRYDLDLGPMLVNAAESTGGRDLYAGRTFGPTPTLHRSQLLAFTASGVPDHTFGDAGTVLFERPSHPDDLPWGFQPAAVPEAVAGDALGRTYVAITADSGVSPPDTAASEVDAWVIRLEPDGSTDTSYGEGGAAYLGRVDRHLSQMLERRGLIHVAPDGAVTVALPSQNNVKVFYTEPGGLGVRGIAVDAGSSPIGSDGWRTAVEATGLHRADGRTLLVVAPRSRLRDPGVVAIDESVVAEIDPEWVYPVQPDELLDQSFGDQGALAWRVDGTYDTPPMTTPVVAVGGIRPNEDGTFTVPVVNQQGQPGVVSFDSEGRLLAPDLPGGVKVVRTSTHPNLRFEQRSWVPRPDEVEFRDGALRSAWSDGWHLAGIEYVDSGAQPHRNGLAALRIRQGVR